VLLKRWLGRRRRKQAQARALAGSAPRLLFFGGKGGVGKTTCAGARALALAEAGHRTLLVSVDPAHSVADLLDQPVGAEPVRVTPELDAMELDPDEAAQNYLAEVKDNLRRIAAPELLGEAERQADLALEAPGAHESALFEAITALILDQGPAYDVLVFDTAPTGHTLHLLTLPEIMGAWIEGMLSQRDRARALWSELDDDNAGFANQADPARAALEGRRERLRALRERILEPTVTAFYLVLNPEALAVAETRRARQTLNQHRIPVAGLVINRILPDTAEGEFNRQRREQESEHLAAIARDFADLDHARLPLTPKEPRGLDALRSLANHLSSVFPV
jgi:arsenite-transporting ATPase